MEKDLNKIFEEQVKRYKALIENNYQARYKKAKDKEFILAELKTDAGFVLGWQSLNPENAKLIEICFRCGINVGRISAIY